MNRLNPVIFVMAASLFLGGCAQFSGSGRVSELPEPSHPGDLELMPASLADPIEPVNRVFFAIDEQLFSVVVEPVTRGYNAAVPEPARTGVKNFRNNLLYPVRLGNNALQGKWGNVGTETKRFLINTTVGVLGFGDPATKKFNLDAAEEDFGQTLGKWGWNNQTFIYLPILGASSGRDLLGRGADVFMDPASLFPEGKAVLEINLLSFDTKANREILDTEHDPYALLKLFHTQQRTLEVLDVQPDGGSEDTAQTQTMEALFSFPDNEKFPERATEGSVQPEGFRKPLTYSLWLQEQPAPIAFVMPGLGGHRLTSGALALAELAHLEGYHVVCFSNNLNWEFIRSAPAGYLPGFLDDDLKYIRQLQTAVEAELKSRHGSEHILGKPSVMGFSMGGWYTLNLCATNPRDTYQNALSINPPLDLTHGLRALDRLFRVPNGKPNRDAIMQSALLKMLLNRETVPQKKFKVPYTDAEASYVIGLSYRFTLRQTILASHDIAPSRKVYRHVDALSYEDYYDKIVAPRLAERGIPAEALADATNLRTREAGLMAAPGLKLVLTSNDFLLTAEDLVWFRAKFGDRVIYDEKGGHMGHIWKPEVKAKMREAIRWKVN
jgi:phospholipid-binding lipoprotein MlaA